MTNYRTRVSQLTVLPVGQATFSEMATTISIDDEAGGEFVVIQQTGPDLGKVQIAPDEWPELRAAIDQMIAECEDEK